MIVIENNEIENVVNQKVKNAANTAKNRALKSKILKIIMIVVIIFLSIVVIAAAIKDGLIKDSVAGYGATDTKNEAEQILANIETIKVSPQYAKMQTGLYVDVGPKIAVQEGEYEVITNSAIGINIENKIQDKIKKLEKSGIENRYISEENLYKYIKAFVIAEYITQYPDLRSADKIGTPTASNEFQGCIQIHRALSDGQTQILSYIEKSIFDSYISNNNIKAAEHFTLDTAGNIIVAGWTRVTTNITSNMPDVENITEEVKYALTTNSIDYKSLVESYTMPFDLLWTFTVMGNDPDFAYELAQLALNSQIIFTVQDNVSTSTVNYTEEYDKQEKTEKQAEITITIDNTPEPEPEEVQPEEQGPEETVPSEPIEKPEIHKEQILEAASNPQTITEEDSGEQLSEENNEQETEQNYIVTDTKNIKIENEKAPISYKTNATVKTETCTTNIELTYADTWIVEFKNTFSNTIPDEMIGEPTVTEINDSEYKLDSETTLDSDSEIEDELLKYKIELCGGEEAYQQKENEGRISGSIGTIYCNNYSRVLNQVHTRQISTLYNTYVQETPTVTEKDSFTQLFMNSKSAKSNILNVPDWFFEALEQSTKAADMIDMLKYLFYKSTGNSYGTEQFNFKLFAPGAFSAIEGIYGNTIEEKVWFALRGEGYSKEAVAGIMGNIYAESAFNPDVIEKGSGIGFGLCQWSFGRRTQLEAYAQSKGVEPSDVDTQIEFLLTEINNGVGPAQGYATNQILAYKGYTRGMWENASTPEDAATAFCWIFERPGIPNMSKRTEKARQYYEIYENLEAGGSYKAIKNGIIVGEYTDGDGKTYTIFNQGAIATYTNDDEWKRRCNRAAQISICSAYYRGDVKNLIYEVKSSAPLDTNLYDKFGLKYQSANGEIQNYTYSGEKIKSQVLGGKKVVLYLRGSDQGCDGTSKNGVKWAGSAHWVAILGYRQLGGKEQIFVSDSGWGHTGWWPIDEFDGMVISVVLVNEK